MRESKPELLALNIVNWQLFCTFTLRRELPLRYQVTMFFALLRKTARDYGVAFWKLIWCLRLESGERTGRRHLHALIAGLPAYVITPRTCLATMSKWELLGGGMARIRVYDATLDGADYILKGLEQAYGKCREGANFYEFTKFGGTCDVTLSESLCRVVQGRRCIARTRRSATRQREVSGTPEPKAGLDQPPLSSTVPSAVLDRKWSWTLKG